MIKKFEQFLLEKTIYYNIFESIQISDKILDYWISINSRNKLKKLSNRNQLILDKYYQFKDYLKSLNKLNYLHILGSSILYGNYFNLKFDLQQTYNISVNIINKIIKYDIKIDLGNYYKKIPYKKTYKYSIDYNNFIKDVDEKVENIEVNKFINNWAPGFLKKGLKSIDNFNKLKKILIYKETNMIDQIDTKLLRGKMSLFKEPDEWINYISSLLKNREFKIKNIKDNNNIDIYYEDNDWLIYYPKDYDSINIFKSPHWCIFIERVYNKMIMDGHFYIIVLNKINAKDSYIMEFRYKSDWKYKKNPDIYDYYHKPIYQYPDIIKKFLDRKEYSGDQDEKFLSWLKIKYPNKNNWVNITNIECSNNHLNNLKGIENLINLTDLHCSNNNLTTLIDNIKNLRNLIVLDCNKNNINSLKGIENLKNLVILDCGNNNLSNLSGIENLGNLEELNCRNNNLSSLKEIDGLRNLKYLYYGNNNFNNNEIKWIKEHCEKNKIELRG